MMPISGVAGYIPYVGNEHIIQLDFEWFETQDCSGSIEV